MTARVSKQDQNTQELKRNPTLIGQYKTCTFSMQTPFLNYKQTYNTPTNADRSEIWVVSFSMLMQRFVVEWCIRKHVTESTRRILLTPLWYRSPKNKRFTRLNFNRLLELELENFNIKDSSVRSIWTYLTASPCYTTNTNKHNTTNKYCKHY